ncbi:RIP metalloprotease RseP [Adhaeribacter pallidiroseus]|uniref:Zinc metalloprotease n=1 Tax=Adhaeribacter pallidiroseus TaxID=2072847 RepID=A0A369QAE4_9BACT|nr:RIP metalloprotease RseP [Adhaeribacter pallidiroseus]RDC61432.1 putative zinc metalloprotease [Adhaeribacter pallidiroseus]
MDFSEIEFLDLFVTIAQFLLGLSFLVAIHEFGHMLTAKWFGMRVEKYAIGFPPKIIGKQIGETEYMIGAIPLGGFVKISGMVDESLDTNMLNEPPKPYEFRAKPAWQRLIVMLGGVLVNVLAGIIIFVLLLYIYGERYLLINDATYGIVATTVGQQIGLKDGDKIVKVNGKAIKEFDEINNPDLLLDNDQINYTINRDGKFIEIKPSANLLNEIIKENEPVAAERSPFVVIDVTKKKAIKAGLKAGDKIVQVAGQPVQYYHQFYKALQSNKGKVTKIVVERGNQNLALQVPVNKRGLLGIEVKSLLNYKTRHYTFAQSIPRGAQKAFNIIVLNIKGFSKIFRGKIKASNAVSGPIGIASLFGGSWVMFWSLVGMLSMVLAFMNLLPIPALDGGHVMFLTYEMVTGQKPSDKFLENAQKVGMVLLLGLMVYAFGNDIYKLFT